MDSARASIVIDIDAGADPISGRVSAQGGEEVRPFTGWIGLFAALRAAVDGHGVEPAAEVGDGSTDQRGAP
jgi:hypothetical protein